MLCVQGSAPAKDIDNLIMPYAPIDPLAEVLPAFEVLAPKEQIAPFVFCSPHSGRLYPKAFLAQSRLDPLSLRKSEDAYVDQLMEGVGELGAPLIAARFPRALIDANREPYEFDPTLFIESLPDYANAQSARVVGGLGTVPRIVADGEDIYAHRIHLKEALDRVDRLYKPFHATLAALIENTRRRFGYAILIDCHSMPSALLTQPEQSRPDFVIGDRYGASCNPRLVRCLRDAIAGLGYDSQANRPYAGGFITEHYGRPGRGVHAIQIEINRGLYLDEQAIVATRGFSALRADLMDLASQMFADMPRILEQRAAAE
jgi:N-formylglutamate amidohydrolase